MLKNNSLPLSILLAFMNIYGKIIELEYMIELSNLLLCLGVNGFVESSMPI